MELSRKEVRTLYLEGGCFTILYPYNMHIYSLLTSNLDAHYASYGSYITPTNKLCTVHGYDKIYESHIQVPQD